MDLRVLVEVSDTLAVVLLVLLVVLSGHGGVNCGTAFGVTVGVGKVVLKVGAVGVVVLTVEVVGVEPLVEAILGVGGIEVVGNLTLTALRCFDSSDFVRDEAGDFVEATGETLLVLAAFAFADAVAGGAYAGRLAGRVLVEAALVETTNFFSVVGVDLDYARRTFERARSVAAEFGAVLLDGAGLLLLAEGAGEVLFGEFGVADFTLPDVAVVSTGTGTDPSDGLGGRAISPGNGGFANGALGLGFGDAELESLVVDR